MLDYTRILAPFSGLVTRKMANVGDLATPGKPLLQLENEARLQVIADIPESMILKIALGDRLSDLCPARRPAGDRGTVAEVAPTADHLSRTAPIKIDIPADPRLRSGQFARVSMSPARPKTLTVPARGPARPSARWKGSLSWRTAWPACAWCGAAPGRTARSKSSPV